MTGTNNGYIYTLKPPKLLTQDSCKAIAITELRQLWKIRVTKNLLGPTSQYGLFSETECQMSKLQNMYKKILWH